MRLGRYTRLKKGQRGVTVTEREYEPSQGKWHDTLVSIATIGFESDKAYLAYGLESYLLAHFAPELNKIRSVRK